MDPEAFLEVANQVTKLKMFPYFDLAHAIISCLYVREDLAAGKRFSSIIFIYPMIYENWFAIE